MAQMHQNESKPVRTAYLEGAGKIK